MQFVVPLWLLVAAMLALPLSGYLAGRRAVVRKLRPVIRRLRHKAAREGRRQACELWREKANAHEQGREESAAAALPRILALSEENKRLRAQVRMEALLDERIKARGVFGCAAAQSSPNR